MPRVIKIIECRIICLLNLKATKFHQQQYQQSVHFPTPVANATLRMIPKSSRLQAKVLPRKMELFTENETTTTILNLTKADSLLMTAGIKNLTIVLNRMKK